MLLTIKLSADAFDAKGSLGLNIEGKNVHEKSCDECDYRIKMNFLGQCQKGEGLSHLNHYMYNGPYMNEVGKVIYGGQSHWRSSFYGDVKAFFFNTPWF